MKYDCIIVGAGIAGMTAAIYLKRANVNVLLIDNASPGGLLNNIPVIENYPGFKSIKGVDLAYNLYEQVMSLNIPFKYGRLTNIDNHIVTTDVATYEAKRVILAIGRNTKKENKYLNLSYCVLCDANFYKDKIVAIIGNGENIIDEAKYLSNIASKVYLISNKIANISNVEIINDSVKKFILDNNIIKQIELNNTILDVDGVFLTNENIPDTDFLKNIEKIDKYIKVDYNMKTNIDYIYACGDIIKKEVYQLTTSAAEGTIAAINVKKSLM